MGIAFDEELLYVAAMLHDIGLVTAFDNATVSFDEAGGNVAWMFAAGAGWPLERRVRLSEIIVRHMWDSVDPAFDAEGHLLEVGTAIDISGRDPALWAPELRAEVLAAHPRLDLVAEFTACFADQARRKPDSSAAAAVRSGIATPDRRQRPGSARSAAPSPCGSPPGTSTRGHAQGVRSCLTSSSPAISAAREPRQARAHARTAGGTRSASRRRTS